MELADEQYKTKELQTLIKQLEDANKKAQDKIAQKNSLIEELQGKADRVKQYEQTIARMEASAQKKKEIVKENDQLKKKVNDKRA